MDNIIESQIEIVKLLIDLYLRFDDDFIETDDDDIEIYSRKKSITLFSDIFIFRIELPQISDYEKEGWEVVTMLKRKAKVQREKDAVKEVKSGYDCGITIENFQDYKVGDIIETYENVEVKK